jgi:magnesium-transporting ATPase (P-type)
MNRSFDEFDQIHHQIEQEKAEMLCGLLSTVRNQTQGQFLPFVFISLSLSSLVWSLSDLSYRLASSLVLFGTVMSTFVLFCLVLFCFVKPVLYSLLEILTTVER